MCSKINIVYLTSCAIIKSQFATRQTTLDLFKNKPVQVSKKKNIIVSLPTPLTPEPTRKIKITVIIWKHNLILYSEWFSWRAQKKSPEPAASGRHSVSFCTVRPSKRAHIYTTNNINVKMCFCPGFSPGHISGWIPGRVARTRAENKFKNLFAFAFSHMWVCVWWANKGSLPPPNLLEFLFHIFCFH